MLDSYAARAPVCDLDWSVTMTMTAADTRRFLAEEIRVSANIRSPHLIEAIATTPRERFLPPGPWLIRGVGDMAGPRQTDDADQRHVHHDVT
ncbi:MAG: hypothetical protein IMZ75_02275, partial [Actinobacteria bacterium]|nr:hypothetical protein [Actinomycetota bacterium]